MRTPTMTSNQKLYDITELYSPRLKLHANQKEIAVSEGNEKEQESRFHASHVFTPGRSGSGSDGVIQIAD